jgi:hypothetical protein
MKGNQRWRKDFSPVSRRKIAVSKAKKTYIREIVPKEEKAGIIIGISTKTMEKPL